MQKMTITSMNERHIAAIAELEKACFSSPWSYNTLKEELSNPNAVFFAAELEGVLAGYAGMYRILDEGYIANIAVSPLHRRQGIAGALLKEFDNYAVEKELSFLTLEVRRSNAPAISLYSKNGYVQKGVRRNFYTLPTEDAFIMTKFMKKTDL